ncbi:Clavaminate synthase-like protein [Neoconidiobolus thromboides FSU 785]|nr:Clavaminate synthase-like protein [Neoconidiobolus thromboides FSU 785]
MNKTFTLLNKLTNPIKILPSITDALFKDNYYLKNQPIQLSGQINDWDALNKWQDMEWWIKHHGTTLVPVELDRYDKIDSKTELPLTLYIKLFMQSNLKAQLKDIPNYGYLAQYPLLNFIPQLQQDIKIPTLLNCGRVGFEQMMLWMGPENTITPIHFDPYENLFVQIKGSKYLRLYNNTYKDRLYPFKEKYLSNTSRIDPENLDVSLFPNAVDVPYIDTIINEGDMLYLPKGWWHYVKALSPSISLSIWWN